MGETEKRAQELVDEVGRDVATAMAGVIPDKNAITRALSTMCGLTVMLARDIDQLREIIERSR